MEENRFYVYVYLDPRKCGKYVYGEYEFEYEPFYVGKGYGERYKWHLYESKCDRRYGRVNGFKINKINKIKKDTGLDPIIIKYKTDMTESNAIELEIDMIASIGRIGLKCGPLVNGTDGGEGASGRIVTEEQRERKRGKNNPMFGVRRFGKDNPFYGKKHKDGYGVGDRNHSWKILDKDEILRLYNDGMPLVDMCGVLNISYDVLSRRLKLWNIEKRKDITDYSKSKEHRENLSKSLKGKLTGNNNPNHRYVYMFVSPNGEYFEFENLNDFCRNHNLRMMTVVSYFSQNINTYMGWRLDRKLK